MLVSSRICPVTTPLLPELVLSGNYARSAGTHGQVDVWLLADHCGPLAAHSGMATVGHQGMCLSETSDCNCRTTKCFEYEMLRCTLPPTLREASDGSSGKSASGKICRCGGLNLILVLHRISPCTLVADSPSTRIRSEERRVGKECRCRWL